MKYTHTKKIVYSALTLAILLGVLPTAISAVKGNQVQRAGLVHQVASAEQYNAAISQINDSQVTDHFINITANFTIPGKVTGFANNHTTIIGNGHTIAIADTNAQTTYISRKQHYQSGNHRHVCPAFDGANGRK